MSTEKQVLPQYYTGHAEGYKAQANEPTAMIDKPPGYEILWEDGDPENPQCWPLWYKGVSVVTMSLGATVVSLFSTLYTSGIPGLEDDFHISRIVGLLGVFTYLLGMGAGTIIFAPLSEVIGRRPVYLASMTLFLLIILPSALADNIEAILVSRLFAGLFGSAVMGNSPASVNDIVSDQHRPFAIGIWSIGPTNGPVYGPIIGGFIFEYLGWRWTNWIVLIIGGAVLALMCCIKETYAPVILRRRAAIMRKRTGDPKWWTRFEGGGSLSQRLQDGLCRPFVMLVTEPICMFWDGYVAIVYSGLYLCFVAYPIAFQTERGWSPGISGLSFVGIGTGVLVTIACEPLFRFAIDLHHKDPETKEVPPEAMVSVVILGAILLAVGQLWFAWTCTSDFHWIVPILSGIPFGAGNACAFIYASNYMARSYRMYTASALAGNMFFRSVMGACLPLAGPAMYASLGLNWAGTLLGLVDTICISIPVLFYLYGDRIRKRSPLIRQMEKL